MMDNQEKEWGQFDTPQEKCPECGSDDIVNEDGPEDGQLPVHCNVCGFNWNEPEGNN